MNQPSNHEGAIDRTEPRPAADIERAFSDISALLDKHELVEHVVHAQQMPNHELVEDLVHRQSLADLKNRLQNKLDDMHAADVARILEALPPERRLLVWNLVKAEHDGDDEDVLHARRDVRPDHADEGHRGDDHHREQRPQLQ